MTFNFKDCQLNSMTFQAWKIKFLNSMTFQVFHDLYKPWMNNLLVMFAIFSSHGLTCGVTKNCLLKHPTAVEGIKMTKPCKILFNKTRFPYKLDNLLFQITHIMSTINSLMFGSRICYFSDTFCKLCNIQQRSHYFLWWKWWLFSLICYYYRIWR